ncbi:hypothetical protein AB0I28_25140 [Phytomonospora sp. NPDC050363]|uniref:hypothetical protein n=1 Tax=Phytomonospora sp. NPDC050363 TaxID=3155642 RepID=UPI0034042F41
MSVLPKPREVRLATALLAVPACLAALVLLRGLVAGWFTNSLGLATAALAGSALAAGVTTLMFRQGRPAPRRTATTLATINLAAMAAIGAIGAVLAFTRAGQEDRHGLAAIGVIVFGLVSVVGAAVAIMNAVALRMLRSGPAYAWFEGEAPAEEEPAVTGPLPGRPLPVLMLATGAASVLFLLVVRGPDLIERPWLILTSITDPGYLGAYAGILVAALTSWVIRGVRAARKTAMVAAVFSAVIWTLFTLSGLISLTSGRALGEFAGSVVLAAASFAVIVMLARAAPLPAHDDPLG